MPPPAVCIDVKKCARPTVDGYSAPKYKRLRTQLEETILTIYPEDARDAEVGLDRAVREFRRHQIRATFYVDFEGDLFVLKYGRKRECWGLFSGNHTPPGGDGDEEDDIFGGDDGGGFEALQENFERGGDAAAAVIITLDELISRKEVQELCQQGMRPAARGDEQQPQRRFLASIGLQGFISRASKLWAKLNRSRTLVRNEQTAQAASNSSRPIGSLEAAIPAELSGIDETGFELVDEPVQVGPHLMRLHTWRRKSPQNRQRKSGLFAKKTHNKRLHL